jgi:hypothetical protein
MSCRFFAELWERTCLNAEEIKHFHGSQTGSPRGNNPVGTEGPQFVRVEFFLRKEPLRGTPCLCGSSSSWHCWNRVRSDELLGGRRR